MLKKERKKGCVDKVKRGGERFKKEERQQRKEDNKKRNQEKENSLNNLFTDVPVPREWLEQKSF